MSNKIYVDTVGVAIVLDLLEDVSAATSISFKVKKPSGTLVSWSASTGASSNLLNYSTVADDLDETGYYEIQALFTLGLWTGRSKTNRFKVYSNFD